MPQGRSKRSRHILDDGHRLVTRLRIVAIALDLTRVRNTSTKSLPRRLSMKHRTLAIACLGLATIFVSSMAEAQYQVKNLASNQVKLAAHTDPLLANGWGLVHGPGTPWWVSDNNSGWATLYDGSGKQVTKPKVLIPTAGNGPSSPTGLNGPGSPTGIVFNGS